ncbi:alpha 1-4-glycosyltransferase family protein [Striga hermonthica]|uniref:Alpha 1-4-glycosyltransferase family protein n=1 Tax=Striga hermonthica TaxID=68872 RepID=A0A9N7R818_STRHE|nr:alpha 1-4-glycosyltransferase family protein [Striga hermonthica]
MRSFYSLISILFLYLLAYNIFTIFCTRIPVPAKSPPETNAFLPETVPQKTKPLSSPPLEQSSKQERSSTKKSVLREDTYSVMPENRNTVYSPKRRKNQRRALEILRSSEDVSKNFESRVSKFFFDANSSCELRFFMTWISSLDSFSDREIFSIKSLFKVHPNGCLVVVSRSMDTKKGARILSTFAEKGLKVTAISPDFNYLFGKTAAHAWYNRLNHGKINPGRISFGQNLSNLVRLAVLYRFGGVYLDTDMIVLKSFRELRNSIGAQAVEPVTRKWSRLNNAVMIFDRGHPLLLKFIEEFASTFNGNKWGHNGPYLVSRVASRVSGDVGYDFTVLPPKALYPVGWSEIGGLFEGPKNSSHSRWIVGMLRQIRRHSFAVHLWNKQSKVLRVEQDSIIHRLMFEL